MPKDKTQGGQPDEQELRANSLAEEQDMEEELEENVGTPPRKVTMEEFVEADQAFSRLMESEDYEFETAPFRPGKNARFVLTERQTDALTGCVNEIGKYLDIETKRYSFGNEEANQKLQQLQQTMKKVLKDGLDSLTPEERQIVNGFNDVMNTDYRPAAGNNLIQHMTERKNPYDLKMNKVHWGLDILGVMTGIPAEYVGNRTQDGLDGRANSRKKTVDDISSRHPEEIEELLEVAENAGIKKLQNQFKGTAIGERLGQIRSIVEDLSQYRTGTKLGQYAIKDHLKAADGLGTFLSTKDEKGRSNYDIIAEAILGKKQNSEQKKAFDLLLGQLNTVCDLDIGVADAIEAGEEYKWNKAEKAKANAKRIQSLKEKLFGDDKKTYAKDKEFLDSVSFLGRMIETTAGEKLEAGTENFARMYRAGLGFDKIVNKITHGSTSTTLEKDNADYIHVMEFGKTLHRKQDDQTLYELLAGAYEANGKSKDDLNRTLLEMNERMDLQIVIPGMEINGEKARPVLVEQSKPYLRQIAEVQRSSNRVEDPAQLKVYLASVLALRRMSVDPAHKDHKKVRHKAAYAKTLALMETEAFKSLTNQMDAVQLATKIKHPGNFDKEFTRALREIDAARYEARLKDKGYQNRLAASARNAARKMDQTGTGVYLLGLKRGSNSGMFDRAVLAMQLAGKNPDAAAAMQSVQIVKEYLSNKMTRRASPSGRERWQSCMEFLHEAMPAEEFKAYCDQVNKARKAKEGSSAFIRPDDFIPQAQRNSVPAEAEKSKEAQEAEQELGGRNSI